MKIGQLTLNGFFNYGNRLQNYALQEILKNYAENVETIWHTQNNFLPEVKKCKLDLKFCVKYLLNWKGYKEKFQQDLTGFEMIRQYKIKNFTDTYQNIKYDFRIGDNISSMYDYFIVGSDQVWNPYYDINENEFLTFAPKYKRIAYAASFGIREIPENKKSMFIEWLSGMEHISVREEAGAEIILKLIGREVPVLVDPTLLLNKQKWEKISKKPMWYIEEDKYILTYFLGQVTKEVLLSINIIAKKNNLKIINLLDSSNLDWYTVSPDEFIYLIKNATLIYTDSFHGTVFSILMQVPFVICERVEKNFKSMSSRIDTLLTLFHLENRRGTNENCFQIENPLEISYPNVEKILDVERKRSNAYLRKALNLDKQL